MQEHVEQEKPEIVALVEYITAMCAPLLDVSDRPSLEVRYAGEMAGTLHFSVKVSADSVRFLVGKKARTADAVRALVQARAGALRLSSRVDVRIDAS